MIWYARPKKEPQDCYTCDNRYACDKFTNYEDHGARYPGYEKCNDYEKQEG